MANEEGGLDQGDVIIRDTQKVLCKLCLDHYSDTDLWELQCCKCVFCKECLQQYVQVMVNEGNVMSITCPDGQCSYSGNISDQEIKKLCSEDTFLRYQRLRFEREVDMDPGRTFCPAPGCEAVCCVEGTSKGETESPVSVTCPQCKLEFCAVCKAKWHPDSSCETSQEILNLEQTGISTRPGEMSNIKRCPKCKVLIEREDGCAQMMCRRCNHLFCWYCLTSLDEDVLLRHYDKGPCKNLLGHNRASLFWHRVQVVAALAGFGLLFLVTCPFLIIALPCIICCKSKCKSLQDLEERYG